MAAAPATPARGWRPADPQSLPGELARWLAGAPGRCRVALDGPDAAQPDGLADGVVAELAVLGRPAVHLPSTRFWRDASLRLEHGRHDVQSRPDWLDAAALRREVLDPLVAGGSYLPSLRDPLTNRSTREPARAAAPGTVLIVSGPFLLGHGLPFERTVHLAMSPAARGRRFAEAETWTLPAFDDYDAGVRPVEVADVVVRLEDPRHPAVRGLPR